MVPSWFLSNTVNASLKVASSSGVSDSRIFLLSASVKVVILAALAQKTRGNRFKDSGLWCSTRNGTKEEKSDSVPFERERRNKNALNVAHLMQVHTVKMSADQTLGRREIFVISGIRFICRGDKKNDSYSPLLMWYSIYCHSFYLRLQISYEDTGISTRLRGYCVKSSLTSTKLSCK